jgi:response regulator RpfG family c-di-GMP phosphodiesterase
MTELAHSDAHILIVDDEPSIVRMLMRALENTGYTSLHGHTDPVEAIAEFDQIGPDLIVLDINMPQMNGYDFLVELSQRLSEDTFLPVLMVSGLPEPETRLSALQAGANHFLTKPIDLRVFVAQVHQLLETRFMSVRVNNVRGVLEELVRRRTAQLQQAHIEILERLSRVAEYRDDTTGQHTRRVGKLAGLVALELGLPLEQASLIERTAPLHDLGKVAIADAVLLKPGLFDHEEREVMRKHSARGAELLSGGTSELVQMAEEIAASHHERWDGHGYPLGLQGKEIPMTARIVAVVDALDAITHVRPYKPAIPLPDAIAEITRERGGQFDPDVVDALLRLYERDELPGEHGYDD